MEFNIVKSIVDSEFEDRAEASRSGGRKLQDAVVVNGRRSRPSWYRASPPPLSAPLPVLEDEDDAVVVLPPVDNSAIVAGLNLSLAGRMFHWGGRSMAALVATLPNEHIWTLQGHVRCVPHGDSKTWQSHIITLFPYSLTFWIRIDGIPSEFWVDESLIDFGDTIGTVRAVDTTKGRIQVIVKVN
ncbi:uncharacterized protein LOC111832394 [Capsella rubella]|uniref:uncharacterized protein LOC111832394 n=1 Tax=Capsella rubella TaxID=81985 RepID=UPI000CD49D25|nr:uncharacterized protein LOC111832394 [Capsella rubella]